MKENIVLIGMPGAGKSTIGVLLAKSMLKSFVDTDLLIQQQYDTSLCKLIEKYDIEGFLKIENDVIENYEFISSVIATGGSAVYGDSAMKKLKKNSVFVYLNVSLSVLEKRLGNIHTRGVAMKNSSSLKELFEERAALYESYQDITIDCDELSVEECVDKIVKALENI